MTIQGVSNLGAVASPYVGAASTAAPAASPQADSSAQVSKGAHYLSQIKTLAASDPAAASKLMTDIATRMRGEASQASGPVSTRLTVLADKLEKAATSGDWSSLVPTGASAGGRVASAYAVTATSR